MHRATVVVLSVIAVLVAGTVALRVAGVWSRGPGVVLVGDSITEQSAETFTRHLGGEWHLTITGRSGYRADQLLPEVPALAGTDPIQVVVNLGTNDLAHLTDPSATEAALEQVGGAFPTARCVHLVTVNERMGNGSDPTLGPRSVELNRHIRALAARRGWAVVPWDQLVRDYEDGGQAYGPLTWDTVHPTQLGMDVLADAYGRALRGCPASA